MIPLDPMRVEVRKGLGDWKTIDQREQTQRRDRKVMRTAGAAAAAGAGLAAVGLQRNPNAAKTAEKIGRTAGKVWTANKKAGNGTKTAGLRAVKNANSNLHGNPGAAMFSGGAATVGGAAAVGAGAKGQHTYQQHKINSRRRSNAKKKVSKMDADPFGISKGVKVSGFGTPNITSMPHPHAKKAKVGATIAAASGASLIATRKKKQPVEKGLGTSVKAGFQAVKAKNPVPKAPNAAKRAGQAAKKGFQAAGNNSSNASSGSYVAGAAARKLRAPAALAGAGGAGYAASQHKENRIYKGAVMHDESELDLTVGISKGALEYIAKAKEPEKASAGRLAAGGAFGAYHGAVAGKKGKKLRATGNAGGGALLGSVGGSAAAALATRGKSMGTVRVGSSVGAVGGAIAGTQRNQKKGYLKPEIKKNDAGAMSPFGIVH